MKIKKITIELEPSVAELKEGRLIPDRTIIYDNGTWFVENEKGMRRGDIRLSQAITEAVDKAGQV